jgi:DNA-binding CsgD family transcriptional regulator
VIISEEAYLMHYGTPRHSGRYPWGSGDDVTQRSKSFLDQVEKLKKQGLSEPEIAKGMGLSSTTDLRALKSIAKHESKAADIAMAERLKSKGMSVSEIGRQMGKNESSVRALLEPGQKDRNDLLKTTANMLKDQVAEKEYIDIGRGVENGLGISNDKLKTAVAMCKSEGYKVHYVKTPTGPGKYTTVKVLGSPDSQYSDVFKNPNKIQSISPYSPDGGRSYFVPMKPMSIDSKRVGIRYAEDGGSKEDGVIYVRPGKDDLSLGQSRYAQVRIAVDGTHYLKGMAVYKDDLPDGVDLLFNTNKDKSFPKMKVLKEMERDTDGNIDEKNPFGASLKRQIIVKDKDGNDKLTSAMNIVNEEGDWQEWSKSISSQMLSKQHPVLIKTQLDLTYENKRKEFDEIMALTNPTVRKKLLETYSDSVDSSAVHLEAAAISKRSAHHVILPITNMKETEIYAPNYRNGETVVLIRHPHGGIFEIPELVVNNNHRAAKQAIGRAKDAVGINSKVAEKLSGADFDGDTVIVIPQTAGKLVKTAPTLEKLKGFDPKAQYPDYPGMVRMTPSGTQMEMGKISNLVTDMTIKGASLDEIAQAVRHSMVVIDAEKHKLNYKQSAIDNGIPALRKKYQGKGEGKTAGGAATLLSRAGSEIRVPDYKPARVAEGGGPINPRTGEKQYSPTRVETYTNAKGELITKKRKSTKLAETPDAFALVSDDGTVVETLYATHSNKLKALANEARLAMVNTKPNPVNNSARTTYQEEAATLKSKLNLAQSNAPLERQAQLISNTTVTAKKQANPNMTQEEIKKLTAQSLAEARNKTGAAKLDIYIEDREWEAIQAGALSNNQLTQILNNSNLERVKQLATPKEQVLMTSTKKARANQMLASGYTQAEVADALGVSVTTLKTNIKD